ncbi:MAG: hypothetical protein M9953_14015 [Thermomicrobiales bacterium]|nr:hypothetical protein [Thermomicrobiales bacterium]
MPPLMFSADEAVGLAMALLTIPANRHSGLPAPVGQALAKIERVLPNDSAGWCRCNPDLR